MSSSNELTKSYKYDAFGNEDNPSNEDDNPFRYCGEYYDVETGTYYLRARYYDPRIGRFTSEDTHWNTSNKIYGDNPQKINEREDALGLKTYSYAPQIGAVMQSGNLYVYAVGNPVMYADEDGEMAKLVKALIHRAIDGVIAAMTSDSDDTWGYLIDIASSFIGGFASDYFNFSLISTIVSLIGDIVKDGINNGFTPDNAISSLSNSIPNAMLDIKVGELSESLFSVFSYYCVDEVDKLMGFADADFIKLVIVLFEDSFSVIAEDEVIKW